MPTRHTQQTVSVKSKTKKSSTKAEIQCNAINQSKPVTPRHSCGTPTDASTVAAAHRRLSFANRSNDDIDCPVHSLMLSFRNLRGLPLRRHPSTEPRSMIFSSVSWRLTWPNHDNWPRLITCDLFERQKPICEGGSAFVICC